MARGHALAGRAGKFVGESRAKIRAFPKSERPRLQLAQCLRDEGVAGSQRLRRAPRQRAKELVARRRRRPFRDDAEHGRRLAFWILDALRAFDGRTMITSPR